MQEIVLNNEVLEFPDNMSDEEIKNVLSRQSKQTKPQKEQSFLQKYGESIIRPTLQAAGSTVGGITGGGLGTLAGGIGAVPGAIAGGGTGYAAGEQLYKTIKNLAGETEQESIPEGVKNALKNVVEGSAMEATGMGLGTAAGKAVKAAVPKVGGALKNISSSLYNVPKQSIERIVERPDAVKKYVNKDAYEIGLDILDQVKQKDAQYTKGLNKALDDVISTSQKDNKLVDVSGVINTLQKRAYSIKGMTDEALQQKKELLDRAITLKQYLSDTADKRVSNYLGTTGKQLKPMELASLKKSVLNMVSPQEAQALKRQLQESAQFTNDTGFSFMRQDAAGKAIRKASTKAKDAIEKVIPEVRPLNKKLQDLIKIKENNVVKSALKPQGIENTVKNLQSSTGNKGFLKSQIRELDKTLGTNLEEQTKDIAASKYLKGGDVLSNYATGRSAYPILMGGYTGGVPGAIIGGVVGSPATFRAVAPKIGSLKNFFNLTAKQLEEINKNPKSSAALKALIYDIGREKQ